MLPFAFALVLTNVVCLGWTIRIYRRQRRGLYLAVCVLAALSLLLACTGLVYALRLEQARRQPLLGPVRPATFRWTGPAKTLKVGDHG